jgi:quinol monooxygenase YgiN
MMTKALMGEYKIKKGKLVQARKAIIEFVHAVWKNEPGTLHYGAYQFGHRGRGFVHFMAFRNAKAERIHGSTEHVRKFRSILYPLCEEKPKFTEISALV